MVAVIDKPPIVGGAPPELPPFLRKRRSGPERRQIIMPDMIRLEQQTNLMDQENNWQTTIYQWMVRITGESIWDVDAKWELAHTSMRRYRQWLETYEFIDGIPPHVQFGGAIEAGTGDPTFYPRWREYAKEMFA